MSDAIVDGFLKLFRGRSDCYGLFGELGQTDELGKRKRAGGCVKMPLTREHFVRHLHSTEVKDYIGVYPCIGDKCSWGCVDVDNTDDPTIARHIQALLAHKQITSWVERTEGGFHAWVFPEDPLVSSAIMRRALMAACLAAGYTPKEVNPKSEDVGRGPGNYVRLPFPGVLSDSPPGIRMMMLEDDYEPSFERFIRLANATRAKTADLASVAALYTPPPTSALTVDAVPPLDKQLTDKLSGIAWTVFNHGPLDGSDRSGTLTRLAHLCAESGLTAEEAFSVVLNADARWGKYGDRPDRDEQLLKIIGRAYK